MAGSTGDGLGEAVRQAYSFLSNNYSRGDEIFCLGFSRGAYTARAVAGLIGEVGLLKKNALGALPEIFNDVQHKRDPHYRPKNPDIPFPRKPSAGSPRYVDELLRRGMTDMKVTVKAIGVWDTVGSLGLPRIEPLIKIGLQATESKRMGFYDTKLSKCVENAFQALALDERRTAFSPAVWEKPRGNTTTLRQVWFPGVHSNVGGGYDDQELANITLAWMIAQLSPFLDMYPDYVMEQAEENNFYYHERRKRVRPWSFGKLYNSMIGVYALGGGTRRTPGCYYAVDPETGRQTDRPLHDTCEYVHPSVRSRIRLRGPGMEDHGFYEPPAMDDWKLVIEYPGSTALPPHSSDPAAPLPPPPDVDGGGKPKPNIYWRARFADENVSTRILPEAPMWGIERKLLGLDRETEEYVLDPPPTKSRGGIEGGERRSRRSSRLIEAGPMDGIVRESRDDRDDKRRRRRRRRSVLEPGLADDERRQSPPHG